MMMRHLSGRWSGFQEKNLVGFKGTQRLELMKNEIELSTLSYSRYGPKELWPSISNYVLQVSSSNNPRSPVAFLYFLDSGGGSYPEVISSAQAEWFRQKAQEINPDSRLIRKWLQDLLYTSLVFGSINKERVAPQEAENGIMKLLAKRVSVKAIFVGHNHGLDWCCPFEKTVAMLARHTGYGGYGNWARGARNCRKSPNNLSLLNLG
ncbi:hypothetical protein M0R45_030644 [Rubus argutus]|uniref:Uncharacterized protein n=1 Tax=Rubus argutus TaxID=59490 RepID=A0AAW1WBM7_RUBAR